MKWTHVLAAAIALFVLQHFQHSIANIRLDNVTKSLHNNNIEVCHQPVDDGALLAKRFHIKRSPIHDFGLFANASIPCGSIIYDAYTLKPIRMLKYTPFDFSFWGVTPPVARVNHRHMPSARITFQSKSQTWVLYALRELSSGDEITVDYLDRPYFAPPPYPQWDITTAASTSHIPNSIGLLERVARFVVIICKWILLPSVLIFPWWYDLQNISIILLIIMTTATFHNIRWPQ